MAERDPAAGRYAIMQLARLGGMAMVVIGAAMLGGAIPGPHELAIALFICGAVEFFFLPLMLARRWRSPKE
ncbi:hypothetical protein GRI58_01980 [Porphyrobacter algicida]|uniref:Uncharacterized protein n=1 Tax=Qipengyuania algicida TaxID=1836209 RepID=A0A845ABH0_9SPHN|nr:hypothetical protein [Qipengyuania algicida]MXP27590.1 hypothetical protein [Qipengyuania algicida]